MFSQINVLYPKPAVSNTTKLASQSLTVSTVAVAPTGYTDASAGGAGCQLVTFDIQAVDVRCRWDGTDPTSTVGHLLKANNAYTWAVSQYNSAKFIRDTAAAADATIFASALNT